MISTRSISRTSKIPLYQQIYEIVRAAILAGDLKPGDLLPAESILAQQYGVSRSTIRQGFALLVDDGLVSRQPGRGTFIATPSLEQVLTRIVSFTEDMLLRGLEPSSKVLHLGLLRASTQIAEQLEIPNGEDLALIVRLRLASGEPISIEKSYLVHKYCPQILERCDYAICPLRQALAQDYGIKLVRAKQTIRAHVATYDQAKTLGVDFGAPVLAVQRVTYDQLNRPLEYLESVYRADRYSLFTELSN
jgi:GntR family transcriptional regulator